MKEVLILFGLAAALPALIFPTVRFAARGRYRADRQKRLLLKLLTLFWAASVVVVATVAFRWAGVKGNAVLVVSVLYAYGVYVLAKQRYG